MTLTVNRRKDKKGTCERFIDREQFFKIWGFMILDLKLEKTELLVYAIIFSFYKYQDASFSGSREYLQSWSGAGRTAVDSALSSLEKKGLIYKQYERFGRATKAIYEINTDKLPTSEMFTGENTIRDIHERVAAKTGGVLPTL